MHHPTDRITHTMAFVTPVVEHWLEREIAQWVHPMKDRSDDPSHHERTLYLWATSRSRYGASRIRGRAWSSWNDGSLDRSFLVEPLSYFSFQPVLHDWCNKGRGECSPVYGMMHIKEPLLLIGKSSPRGGSGFPLTLTEWFFTICLTPYNRN